MANPLIDRYYSPLGLNVKDDTSDIEAARQQAIRNIQAKLARETDADARRELIATLKKFGERVAQD